MIAVDTSALIAVLAQEDLAEACENALAADALIISAATLTEVRIVAAIKALQPSLDALLVGLGVEVVEVDEPFAELAAASYVRWGKGFHPARLNYGDCFSYALAQLYDCPLLYIGDDFARTDVVSALG